MNRVKLHIIAEGQTEETFIRDVLAPYMKTRGILISQSLLGSGSGLTGGGDVRFDRALKDIMLYLQKDEEIIVSTMFDYFRIDKNWPGKDKIDEEIQNGNRPDARRKSQIIENATSEEIECKLQMSGLESAERFIPYIEMHEFEALLFSDAVVLSETMGIDSGRIIEIVDQFDNPEEINDNPESAPSKRLQSLKRSYRKIATGKKVAQSIGIDAIRAKCPHFNDWLSKLENLAE